VFPLEASSTPQVKGDKTRRRELLGVLGGGLWRGGMEEKDIHEE
jgi:hypothetical protein